MDENHCCGVFCSRRDDEGFQSWLNTCHYFMFGWVIDVEKEEECDWKYEGKYLASDRCPHSSRRIRVWFVGDARAL